jgi:REP element-mobilizing transposase RayT
MPYYPDQHQRRSIRLREYDYSTPGAYFVTICVEGRKCSLAHIVEDQVRLTASGEIVADCWASLPNRFGDIQLDTSVVMPNHFHATILLVGARFIAPTACPTEGPDLPGDVIRGGASARNAGHQHASGEGAINRAPTMASSCGGQVVTLGEVVRTFKAASAIRVRREVDPGFAWQRNYFERVLRDEERLARARRYVAENPARWADDPEGAG